ncbi:DNA internalization-related competence protein ComEC/Rec2 [Candidatus Uabimicrobium amorphum]|uniref:Competence protein ComEC n=1 Tax=Uabimicrobium amorphum TaxID=2596890 RepID=A0A5S9IHX7_UABAM|nr:DNA internalization-related competence protein ComEC/Rec2 [Candidatus Uabimicrobium amorphum]BBM81731.1 competence protein ComEC [Candidatus Uabimicrobium amorphum]
MTRLSIGLFLTLYSLGIALAIFYASYIWMFFAIFVVGMLAPKRNFLVIVFVITLSGFLRVNIEKLTQPQLFFNDNTVVTVRGILIDNVFALRQQQKNTRRSFVIQVCSRKVNNKWVEMRCKMYVVVFFAVECDYLRGGYFEVDGIIRHIRKPRNPGEFNRRLFAMSRGVFYDLYVKKEGLRFLSTYRGCPLFNFAKFLQAKIAKYLVKEFGTKVGGVAAALCFGERFFLDSSLRDEFVESGAMHLLAISGFHIVIITGILLRLCTIVFRDYYTSVFTTLFLLIVYAFIAGMTVSITRAVVMMCIYLLSSIVGREKNAMHSLLVTALAFLFFDPFHILRIDFQMSFIVCFFILHVGDRDTTDSFTTKLKDNIIVAVVATLSSFPLTAYYFYSIAPAAMITGFALYIPIYMSLLLVLTWVFSPVSLTFIGDSFFGMVYGNIALLLWLLGCVRSIPGGFFYVPQPHMWQILVFYLLLMITRPRNIMVVCVLFVIFCTMIFFRIEQDFRLTVLDVGHGDCIFVEKNGRNYLYDCGSFRILSFLRAKGIYRIDAVIISHGDIDHCRALSALIQSVHVDKIICNSHFAATPLASEVSKYGVELCVVRDREHAEGFTFLYPGEFFENKKATDNDHSLGVLCEIHGKKIVLLGDMEDKALRILLEYNIQDVYLMQVPHHGSKNNFTEKLLRKWRPKYATLSSKKTFPCLNTLHLYAKYSVKVLATYSRGAIVVHW